MKPNKPVHNLQDLRERRKAIRLEYLKKEAEVRQDIAYLRTKMNFLGMAGAGLRFGASTLTEIISSNGYGGKGKSASLIANLLRFGAFKLSSVAADKFSKNVAGIFKRKKNK